MRPEIKRQRPVVDKWIDAVGERVEVNRDEGVRVGAAADYRPEPEIDGIRSGARHDHVHAALHEQVADPEADLQHGVTLVQSRGTRCACGWMPGIDGDSESTQWRSRVRYSGRPSHSENESTVLPHCEVSVRRSIQ